MSACRQSRYPHECRLIPAPRLPTPEMPGTPAVYADSGMWGRQRPGFMLEIVGSHDRLEVTGHTSFGLLCESHCATREAVASMR